MNYSTAPLTDASQPMQALFAPRDLMRAHLHMKGVRAEMEQLVESIASTFMTYALVGHSSPSPWSALEDQMAVVAGEYNELKKAVETRDVKELRDGIGDLLYTVIGMAYRAGIPLTQDFEQVVRSNLTKFDHNHAGAEETKRKYEALGVKTYCQPVSFDSGERSTATYYITFVDGDQVGTDGKKYPNNKWLKSTKFVDISLAPLANYHPLVATSNAIVTDSFQGALELLATQDNPNLYHAMVSTIAGIALIASDNTASFFEVEVAFRCAQLALVSFLADYSGDAERAKQLPQQFGIPGAVEQRYLQATITHLVQAHASQAEHRFLKIMEATINEDCPEFLLRLHGAAKAVNDNQPLRDNMILPILSAMGEFDSAITHSKAIGFVKSTLRFLTGCN